MITYNFDPTIPFTVLQSDDTHTIVNGTSKVIQTSDGEFGGVMGTWRVPKVRLLTKGQKRALRWKRRMMGTKSANDEFDRLCEIVIATHMTKHIL